MLNGKICCLVLIFFINHTLSGMKESISVVEKRRNGELIKIFSDALLSSKDPLALMKSLLEYCSPYSKTINEQAEKTENFHELPDFEKLIIRLHLFLDPSNDPPFGMIMLWAASVGQVKIFKELLLGKFMMIDVDGLYCAEPNNKLYYVRDESGNTAFHVASFKGKSEIIQIIARELGFESKTEMKEYIRTEMNTECLYSAIQENNYDEARVALESSDADPNGFIEDYGLIPLQLLNSSKLQDYLKKSPLHYAVEVGSLDIIKLLVNAGAEINVKDRRSKTPKDYAQVQGRSDIVEFLNQFENRNLETKLANQKIKNRAWKEKFLIKNWFRKNTQEFENKHRESFNKIRLDQVNDK